MFATSQDILFLTIAFCVLLLSVMLAIGLYYLVVMLKRAKEMTDIIKDKVEKVLAVIDIFRNKIEPAANLAAGVVGGIKQVVEYLRKQSDKKSSRRKKSEE